MYYVDFYSLFNQPDKDRKNILNSPSEEPHEPSLFDEGAWNSADKRVQWELAHIAEWERTRRSQYINQNATPENEHVRYTSPPPLSRFYRTAINFNTPASRGWIEMAQMAQIFNTPARGS